MSSSKRLKHGEPILRTIERCEIYLDRLALVIERAGDGAAAFLPLVRRLERELAEASQEDDLLQRLRERRLRRSPEDSKTHPATKGAGHD